MQDQLDLFSDEIPEADQQVENNSAAALKVAAQDTQLSPGQKRFNRLLARIDKLKGQLTEVQMMHDAHRPVFHQTLTPLRERHQALVRDMVLWLDERLQRKRLSAVQKRNAATILCSLSMQLAMQGDEEMKIMHDKHSSESLAQIEQFAKDDMREMMESMLGEPLAEDESLETLEDLFRVGMERLREADAAEEEAYQQLWEHSKKPSKAQLKAKVDQQEAETTLRKVFRQLVSALHPDRENDPGERTRKTTLMSEANAAYDRRDLVALLQIQLRTELTDTASIAKMANEKVASLSLLLKQQVEELENELYNRRHAAYDEFDLGTYETLSMANLQRNLRVKEAVLEKDLNAMQQDLQQLEDDKYFKRWLKDQNRLFEEPPIDAFDDWNDFPFGRR
ncbi:MAG: hypothetical protein OEX82_03935 [Nitrosomonas sp.]|nr:hypothetical protein [Nitrosomonas sp.]